MGEKKKLYLSKDKKLCGVCGGFADYFGIDPTIVRIIFLVLVFAYGFGILPYFICALVMPKAPD